MTQISFDFSDNTLNTAEHERKVFDTLKIGFDKLLIQENLDTTIVYFKPGTAETSQYSSVYLVNEGCILCRICFRGKQHYISVPSKYTDLIPSCVETKIVPSDNGYCRILINSLLEVENLLGLLCNILSDQLDTLPCDFDCCSKYMECSDAMRCVHNNPNMAIKCAYRKKIKNGEIFYGKNRNR